MKNEIKVTKKKWIKPSYEKLKFSQTFGGSIQGIQESATSFGFHGTIS